MCSLIFRIKHIGLDIFKKGNGQVTAEYYARLDGHVDILELLEIWTLPKKIEEAKARMKTKILETLAALGMIIAYFICVYFVLDHFDLINE